VDNKQFMDYRMWLIRKADEKNGKYFYRPGGLPKVLPE
jgi:hypothetical protein